VRLDGFVPPAPPTNARLLEGYRGGGWLRSIAGSIRGEDFDRVFSELTVSDDRAAGTEADVLQDAVEVNVVTEIRLGIEIVAGLGPLDLHLGAAVAKTVRAHTGGCVRRGVVIGIGRRGGEGDGIAEWADVIAEIDGAGGKTVNSVGAEETECGVCDAAGDAEVKGPVQIVLRGEVRAVVLRRYPGDVGVVGADFVDGDDRSSSGRGGVAWQTDAVEGGLGGGVPVGALGIDAEGVGIPRIEGSKGVANGGLGQDDSGAYIISAPDMVIEITRIGGGRIPRQRDGVGGFGGDTEVAGGAAAALAGRGRGRTEDHCEDQGHCSDMGRER
jgi:hypothetical protein